MPIGDLTTTPSPKNRKALIASLVGVVTVLALVGLGRYVQVKDNEAVAPAAEVASPLTCGATRVVTVTGSDTWKIVRESKTASTGCDTVSVYKNSEQMSTLVLPAGVTAIDGDEGLWTYRDGNAAVAADQEVPNDGLTGVWLIARTTDGHSVSANLADGKLTVGN